MSYNYSNVLEIFPCVSLQKLSQVSLPLMVSTVSAGFPSPAEDFMDSKIDIKILDANSWQRDKVIGEHAIDVLSLRTKRKGMSLSTMTFTNKYTTSSFLLFGLFVELCLTTAIARRRQNHAFALSFFLQKTF